MDEEKDVEAIKVWHVTQEEFVEREDDYPIHQNNNFFVLAKNEEEARNIFGKKTGVKIISVDLICTISKTPNAYNIVPL